MTDDNRKQIEEHTRDARGGGEQDSQGDGVADAAVETPRVKSDGGALPSTNREAVPGGLEGSIMEEGEDDAQP